MLIAPDDVKAGTYVNFNVDDALLAPAIRETQDVWLQSILGTPLYRRLLQMVYAEIENEDDSIEDEENANYKELLDDYVIPYLEKKVQAVLVMPTSYQQRNLGTIHPSDTNLNAQQISDVLKTQQRLNAVAARFATALSHYLCEHRSAFPELNVENCGCGAYKPMIGKTFVHCGIQFPMHNNCCD